MKITRHLEIFTFSPTPLHIASLERLTFHTSLFLSYISHVIT